LQVEGEKMAKRTGNFYTVRDLIEQGFDPLALRYALIQVPYGKPLNFTMQSLRDAERNVERMREAMRRVEALRGSLEGEGKPNEELQRIYDEAFDAMCDDLNTSVAIAKSLEGARVINRIDDGEAGLWFLQKINALLGLVCNDYQLCGGEKHEEEPKIEGRLVSEWIEERETAKQARDYAAADAIREKLTSGGIELRDSPEGTTWIKRPVGV
jgi:cysteinyl-tRNA synthetase